MPRNLNTNSITSLSRGENLERTIFLKKNLQQEIKENVDKVSRKMDNVQFEEAFNHNEESKHKPVERVGSFGKLLLLQKRQNTKHNLTKVKSEFDMVLEAFEPHFEDENDEIKHVDDILSPKNNGVELERLATRTLQLEDTA